MPLPLLLSDHQSIVATEDSVLLSDSLGSPTRRVASSSPPHGQVCEGRAVRALLLLACTMEEKGIPLGCRSLRIGRRQDASQRLDSGQERSRALLFRRARYVLFYSG